MSDLERLRDERERAQIALGKAVIVIMGSLLLVCGGITLMIWGYVGSAKRSQENREHQCAIDCVPHRVVSCPHEGKPVCSTNEPWPATFIAGEKPVDKPWDGSKYPERK
jgi:hypothetical protein